MSRGTSALGRRTAAARGGRWAFVARWVAAVAVSMAVAGLLEYVLASRQLEERTLQEASNVYLAEVANLETLLAEDLGADGRQQAIQGELDHLKASYGTEYVALFDSTGRALAVSPKRPQTRDEVDSQDLRTVISSQRPQIRAEADEGEVGEAGRYEFLFPVKSPDGLLVLEVDQRDTIINDLLTDLRWRKALALLAALLIAIPLSYLLGGHTIYRRTREAEVAADTDALTGVAGRRPFRPVLETALSGAGRRPVALALIDIDNFKQVNDQLGHSYGDRVLVALAGAFVKLRASDTPFRLGGDEFAVVLPDSTDEQAVAVIERVGASFATQVPGVTFSCGIAAAHGVFLQELWERADAALYQAKASGRRQTVTFTGMSTLLTVSPARLDAVTALLNEDSALSVAFQPIWDLRKGSLIGHEALLRLPPGVPIDGPQQAFALAERLGIVVELDQRARLEVLRAVRETQWQGLLFINIHPDALRHLDVDAFETQVIAAGLAAEQVVLEVTEHAGMDSQEPIRVLKQAQSRGFRLALDDMGHGNAGLRALTLVRFDVVKIDRDVIVRLGTDPSADATVAAATTFVQLTGGWVIAEGIEDQRILTAVCDTDHPPNLPWMLAGQGYLLGRPSAKAVPIDTRLDTFAHDWTDPERSPLPLTSKKPSNLPAIT